MFLRFKRIIQLSKTQPLMKSSGITRSYYLAPLTIVFVLLVNFIFEVNGSAPKAEPLPVNNKGFAAAAQSADTRTFPGDSVPSGPNKKQPGLSPAKASGETPGAGGSRQFPKKRTCARHKLYAQKA
ncbi:MAG: hypothetical protein ACO1NZ_10855 [Adhaeribacter sp.]